MVFDSFEKTLLCPSGMNIEEIGIPCSIGPAGFSNIVPVVLPSAENFVFFMGSKNVIAE